MTLRLPVLLAFAICVGGCGRGPVNTDCRWPVWDASSHHQSSLTADALRTEDLAIRYADAHYGPRSGHFESMVAYGRERDRCMARLFGLVAEQHGVTGAAVRQAVGRRPVALDLIVMLSFALLYGLAAYGVAGWLRRSLPAEGWPIMLVAVVTASVVAGGLGVAAGEWWAGIIESVRLGTTHLSNRAFRIPWHRHLLAVFVVGVLLFWLAAALRAARGGLFTRRFTVPSGPPR